MSIIPQLSPAPQHTMVSVLDDAFVRMTAELALDDDDSNLPGLLEEFAELEHEYGPVSAQRHSVLPSIPSLSKTAGTTKSGPPCISTTLEPLKRLGDSLFHKGFLSGAFSDFTLRVLGVEYALHRVVLLHNSYFASLLEGPWKEHGSEIVEITIDDPNVTPEGVTIVLGRVYGRTEVPLTASNARSVLAAALFFGDVNLCQLAVDFIAQDVSHTTVLNYLLFADEYCYGEHSVAILEECLTFLCREGYGSRRLRKVFQEMPVLWLQRIVSSDCFWAPTEEDRWTFVSEIVDLRRGLGTAEKSGTHKQAWAPSAVECISKEPCLAKAAESDTSDSVPCSPKSTADKLEEQVKNDDGLADVLHLSVAYEHIPFRSLLRIRSVAEKRREQDEGASAASVEADAFCDMLERAAWTQLKLQHLITTSTAKTTHLGIDEPIVPRADTRHIDGYCLSHVVAEGKLLVHDGSTFPAMRFGVEFQDLHEVATREKVYSEKFFYAGSMWQIYLQTLPRNNPPILGVYLRRMPVPAASKVNGHHGRLPPSTPYVDPRDTAVTWFQLYCFFGDDCVLLESKPDVFQIEQSWGWKLSKLYDSAFAGGKSLRCCVVLGHV
ncbi:hypothetical protein HDU86_002715 [Geranomyces michiganensis]|nr:hypothetical protein HDU86_002715 [Geranomyces michiganensis]